MKPRVVILSAFLTPFRSGAEACAEEIALRLADTYDITIVTAKLRSDLKRNDLLQGKVPIVRVGLGLGIDQWLYPFLAPIACWGMARHAPTGSPIIIHAILETFAGLALYLCKWFVPNAKRILTLQTTNRSFLKGPIVRSPDRVTAISAHLKSIAATLGRADVTIIPNGINLREITEARRHHVKIPGRILFVGRLEKMKGVDLLLRAFANLVFDKPPVWLKRNTSIASLRIVGDGSERAALQKLGEDLKIADRVTFTGYILQPKVYDEFASAEIFCGFSKSEALGNVFLEAAAAGCAVISSNIGGIPEIIKDGKTGKLVDAQESAVTDGLKNVFNDDVLRADITRAASAFAEKYDWENFTEQYAKIYSQLLR
jgi:glycosyltransferase involved in cell wall biosynthesis